MSLSPMSFCIRRYTYITAERMPKALSQAVRDNLEKCKAASLAAVDAYNRPGPRFRTAQYLVMIVIAWTALFHAIFYKRRKRPWYRKKDSGSGNGIRYQKIDGEPKHWDLSECIKQFFVSNNPAERKNLEFLIGLRNKIEHRYLPELDPTLYGECQAALLNLEEMIVTNFGNKYALTEQLAVALQFSQEIPPEKKAASKRSVKSSVKTVQDYVEKFRGGLPGNVLNSMKYSFSVYLVPKVTNREGAADASIKFIKVDEANSEELDRLEKLNVLIKEKRIPIANLGLFKPSDVVRELNERLPFKISMNAHTNAWKYFKVRPPYGDTKREITRSEHCIFDEPHGDYLYTRSWIEHLVRAFGTEDGYVRVVGRAPKENEHEW